MATTSAPFVWYNTGSKNLNFNSLLTNDIKVALCTSAYTPSAAHEFYDVSITNELPTALGYTAGGISLTTKSLDAGATASSWEFVSANPSWTATGGSLVAHIFVLYNNTPASSKPLIGYGYLDWNGGTPQNVTVVDTYPLSIVVPATGWFYTTVTGG